MNIKLSTVDVDGKVLESYTVPHGSWVQTRAAGAQPAMAVLKRTVFATHDRRIFVVQQPISAIAIRPALLKMVNGRGRWGKNGIEYTGKNRNRNGGTAIDRLRELAMWYAVYGKQGPVPFLSDGEAEAIRQL